jgi:hypothetical protein
MSTNANFWGMLALVIGTGTYITLDATNSANAMCSSGSVSTDLAAKMARSRRTVSSSGV